MNQKKIIPAIILIIAVSVLIINLKKYLDLKNRLQAGSEMPYFEVQELQSKKIVTKDSLNGKVLFINFWASWCRPCIAEMPSMNNLNRMMSAENDFRMLAIIYNENPEDSLRYLKRANLSIPLFYDPNGNTAAKFGLTGVPETYIIDKNGIVSKVKIGPDRWDSIENVYFIRALLNQ